MFLCRLLYSKHCKSYSCLQKKNRKKIMLWENISEYAIFFLQQNMQNLHRFQRFTLVLCCFYRLDRLTVHSRTGWTSQSGLWFCICYSVCGPLVHHRCCIYCAAVAGCSGINSTGSSVNGFIGCCSIWYFKIRDCSCVGSVMLVP
jgi:hypothetical protein